MTTALAPSVAPTTPTTTTPVNLFNETETRYRELLQKHQVSPDRLPILIDYYLTRTPDKPDAAVAIWGPPGVGKTSGVREYARTHGYRLIVLHLQLYDPSDLKGIAIRQEDGTVRWITSSFLPQQEIRSVQLGSMGALSHEPVRKTTVELKWPYAEFVELDTASAEKLDYTAKKTLTGMDVTVSLKPGVDKFEGHVQFMERAVLFLDEISTANTDVQNAALSLVLDRRINEYFLPMACRILAAGNTEEDGTYGNPISSALSNRFLHIRLAPTVNGFLSYLLDQKINPDNRALAVSFLSMYGDQYLHRFNADQMREGSYGFMTPRSWVDWCHQFNLDHPEWMRNITTVGLFGPVAGNTLIGHLKLTDKLPNPGDILSGKPYHWDSGTDRGTALMMIGILVTRYRGIVDAFRDAIPGSDPKDTRAYRIDSTTYPSEFRVATDAMFKFINDHMRPEQRTVAYYLITKIANIASRTLYGAEFDKFATNNGEIIRTVNNQSFG